ncbi:hypothetical protein [Deinococcus daejeonensis]|uniref:DUF669 domain-containing protein n=1 Tax=Deinococcus daejeonensis TaxID=1007098 RepID=A0ABQ2IZ16_9DEIO|nr:hypothetical protein [Deinococcus daejeonensis]GGN32385.1 hypothetical protein GCM10010842_09020 [Deinococcus daejeonensis]
MAIQMQSSKGQQGDANSFQADPGTYVFRLVEIIFDEGSDYEDKTKKYPQANFIWEDEDGDRFRDSFLRVPLGFRLNEKAAWTNRLAALIGRPISQDEDAPKISLDLGPDINSYDDLAAAVGEVNDNGRPAFIRAVALDFEGESLIGRQAQLTLGWNAKGTHLKCAAGGAAPMPTSGKKKRTAAAGEPDQLLNPPPRKANTTEPAHSEFGY